MEEIITITNLTKKYKKKTILNNINLTISRGESIVFTGNNGIGKSTLLKIICGLVNFNSGNVSYSKKISFQYIPEHFPKKNFTIEQYIRLMGKIDGLTNQIIDCKTSELYKEFQIEGMLKTPLKYLSKGSLQKVNVIQALLKKPDVLVLDEPLSGQDTKSQQVFIDKILDLLSKDVTVLMSCHERHLITAITDKVYEIDEGKITSGKIDSLVTQPFYRLSFVASGESDLPDICKNYKMAAKNDLVIFEVPVRDADQFIFSMLENKWSLRGMDNLG